MTKQFRLLKDLSDHRAGETLTLFRGVFHDKYYFDGEAVLPEKGIEKVIVENSPLIFEEIKVELNISVDVRAMKYDLLMAQAKNIYKVPDGYRAAGHYELLGKLLESFINLEN